VKRFSAHDAVLGGSRNAAPPARRLVLALGVTAVAVATGITHGTAAAGTGSDWPVYPGDFTGSGAASGSSTFHGATRAWTSRALRGQIFGEPLVEGDQVVVATETNSVYALSASGGGRIVWSTQVGPAVPARRLPCGDIRPKVGITSTPVIDATRSEVFVVADEEVHRVISHHLVGLSLSTGHILLDQVVDPPGTTPAAQLQRAALTLDAGQVIIASGGNAGDCSTYNGWVVAVPETGGASRTFEVDPMAGNNQGAIWMGGAAPIVDGAGNIWVATGNGSNTSGSSPDYSDSVIELSSSLLPLQSFTPSTWASDNAGDLDLGSSSPALLPDGLVLQVGKSQTAYLLDQSALGGIGGQLAQIGSFCGADVDGGDAFVGPDVYLPCLNGVVAVQVSTAPASLSVLWATSTGSPGPAVIADGLIWTMQHHGNVYGLNPSTGAPVVQFSIGSIANHFPTPSVGDGLLLAASANKVHAFTLTP
jgi:outer membrane protein assembly factor BamB